VNRMTPISPCFICRPHRHTHQEAKSTHRRVHNPPVPVAGCALESGVGVHVGQVKLAPPTKKPPPGGFFVGFFNQISAFPAPNGNEQLLNK